MKDRQDEIVDAIFRAKMLEKYNSDPGPNWSRSDFTFYIFYVVLGLFAFKAFLSS